ncbi:PHP domain-containing protein [Halanaerobaculum tunisiense]
MITKNRLPNFFTQSLTKEPQYIDLHLHTIASDGLIKPKFLKEFLKSIPHLISITDHNSIASNLELHSTPEINIIPGIEVGCQDGFELLIYFQDISDLKHFYINYVEPFKNKYKITRTSRNYSYYLNKAQNYNCLLSIPHPAGVAHKNYLKNKSYIYQAIKQIDAIEIYNHAISEKKNEIAYQTQKNRNKLVTFGSDAHIKKEVLSFYKYQNNNFSKLSRVKKILYNCCSIVALFSKHLHHLLN